MNVALSAICFHERLFAQRMEQAEVPAAAAALGFDAVELLDTLAAPLPAGRWTAQARRLWRGVKHLFPRLPPPPGVRRPKHYEPDVADPLRRAADEAGVRVVAWTLDTVLTAEGAALAAQRAYWQRGITTARLLGAEVLRVTTGGRPTRADLTAARRSLAELVAMAEGLQVAVENHGGLSSDPALLVALLEAVPGAGCCLDFGNFLPAQRDEAVLALAPHAVHVHAKASAFDEQGNERTLPYHRFLPALRRAGYAGWYTIEYEGSGPPEPGIRQTRALLER